LRALRGLSGFVCLPPNTGASCSHGWRR
jgi:hypothetical protein